VHTTNTLRFEDSPTTTDFFFVPDISEHTQPGNGAVGRVGDRREEGVGTQRSTTAGAAGASGRMESKGRGSAEWLMVRRGQAKFGVLQRTIRVRATAVQWMERRTSSRARPDLSRPRLLCAKQKLIRKRWRRAIRHSWKATRL